MPVYPLWEVSPREKGIGWGLRLLRWAIKDDEFSGARRMQREGIRAPVPPQICLELPTAYLSSNLELFRVPGY